VGHASTFGEIIQLGSPLAKPTEWEKRSFLPYYDLHRRGNDLKALIKIALKLERLPSTLPETSSEDQRQRPDNL